MCVFLCTENNISWAIICLVYWRLLINFKVISSFQFSDKIIIHLMFSLLVGPHLTITPALRDDTLFVVIVSRWNWTSPLVSCPLLCVISFFFLFCVNDEPTCPAWASTAWRHVCQRGPTPRACGATGWHDMRHALLCLPHLFITKIAPGNTGNLYWSLLPLSDFKQ